MTPYESLHEEVRAGASALGGDDVAAVKLEIPPRADMGDYSTNAALVLAKVMGLAPREVAERLAQELGARLGGALERTEVAGPGFVNLHLSDRWYVGALGDLLASGEDFGSASLPAPLRINLEYVSANPTGPLHIGHARYAAYGDSLARILGFRGYEVTREFYINDFGSQ
ncbi:MAG TPA: arginine--tRNA ligase, partial [Solirubrobacteraceae bacterium]